jgi:hypothetical protein
MSTLYNLLGIPPDADNETLKKAYREAIKATHPEIHVDDPDARSRFRQIVAAYTLLRDAKQRATYDWLLQQRARLKPCFAQEDQNASHATATILATIIEAVSATVAVIGAVIAGRSAGAAIKSAFAAMINAQRKYGGTLLPPVAKIANQQIDWAKNFTEVIRTPFATVLTILFAIALGLGLNLLLSRGAPPSALVPATKPAVQASTASLSAPLSPTATAAEPARTAAISAPPSPTAVAASDRYEAAVLLARGRAPLSDGDAALARVFLRRAAERDDPQAALALGGTYDPIELNVSASPISSLRPTWSKRRSGITRQPTWALPTRLHGWINFLGLIDKGRAPAAYFSWEGKRVVLTLGKNATRGSAGARDNAAARSSS